MGRLLLVSRLVIADIKRRRVQSALLLVMIATTTTTLTLGLALHKVTDSPFARARAATRGPDVVAELVPYAGTPSRAARQLEPLTHLPGVVGASGPYPLASTRLTAKGIDAPVLAEGRDPGAATIDQPVITAGSWVRPGGAVLERGFADALGLHVGDSIHIGGRSARVTGIAVSTAQCFYPVARPGVIWLTRGDTDRLAGPKQPLGYALDLKLADPAAAPAFANASIPVAFYNDPASFVQTWQDVEHDDFRVVAVDQKALLIVSTLLAILAIASIAVVVGGRMAEQTRRVGLLKAVGATPRLVAVILLAENLLLALTAAVVGLALGQLIAPLLTNPGSGLIGSPPAPALTATTVLEVALVAVVVAVGATLAPAIRGAHTSTIRALNDPSHPPRRRPWLIATSARLPAPLLLGVRLLARRLRRSVFTTASLAIAVMMVTAALTLQHNADVRDQQNIGAGIAVGGGSIIDRVNHLVLLLSAILVVLAGINAIFTAWATVIDARRSTALARAFGATPGQVTAGLTVAQLLPGFVAACIGVPAGLALYELAGGHVDKASPPILWLLAVIPGTLIVVAVLTGIPARIGAHRPVAEVLRTE